ncbi:Rpr2-domain-containing protein [Marasmius fiardii PR-910]|nr:Rpr2-domain-containing protein [Marasmius fiardii PR-910]
MAKKDKNEAPTTVPNRDIIHRLNFLYQASVYLHSIDGSGSGSASQPQASTSTNNVGSNRKLKEKVKTKERERTRKTRKVRTGALAKAYIDTMKVVSTKATVRMDPSIKRTICQGCNTVLIAGSTTTIRVKGSPSHGHTMTYTCLECHHSRRIPAPPIMPMTSSEESSTHTEVTETRSRRSRRGKLQKSTVPRVPPLFARDVGHVVFAGETDISSKNQSLGNGSFIS